MAWAQRKLTPVTEQQIGDALTVHQDRKINGDGTVSIGGVIWETLQHFLANKKVKIGRNLLDFNTPPWVDYDKKKYPLRRANPIANVFARLIHSYQPFEATPVTTTLKG